MRRSRYKGVYFFAPRGKWVAKIQVCQKQKYIGIFNSEIEAAIAYNKAAWRYLKDEAKMNTFILTEDWNNVPMGTKFFFQDGMYFYKDQTEHEHWLTVSEFESISDKFREQTALEFFYYTTQKINHHGI